MTERLVKMNRHQINKIIDGVQTTLVMGLDAAAAAGLFGAKKDYALKLISDCSNTIDEIQKIIDDSDPDEGHSDPNTGAAG